ncbi:hypothetical protein GCM10010885_14820 [Alicyclobacillus cellulosilyticus]|uniref:Uncharacterized protein n=1 Tax=Alicyclobacillus cellulosilyticus TaxID=1003997 RepID=A0A917KDQ8_9BACL|nr:hypothetical protein [Alicyclobacillus cellulosilyticus]GGJ06741.1 hypothetical protein GCM10010885_14820 [Alicyclobacillus cellulosilyticus]
MGEWTWLHVWFPLADVELMSGPIDAKTANVLVRAVRRLPEAEAQKLGLPEGEAWYEVRIAPHHVAPFRGGPWLGRFPESALRQPDTALFQFRERLAAAVEAAKRAQTQ